ncbi:MAG: hypothetical protein AAGH89_02695 [Verrucomicrobiota bacterium]
MKSVWMLPVVWFTTVFGVMGEEEAQQERPTFAMFGYTIVADEIDLNLGEAKGNVVVTGKVKEEAITVRAEKLVVNLGDQTAVLSGWPSVVTKGAKLTAKTAETKILLKKDLYQVQGPATFSLDLGGLKQRAQNP